MGGLVVGERCRFPLPGEFGAGLRRGKSSPADRKQEVSLVEVPAIRVSQPIGDFWICAIPAKTLLDVTYPDPLRVSAEKADSPKLKEWRDAGLLEGNQRPIDPDRLKEI